MTCSGFHTRKIRGGKKQKACVNILTLPRRPSAALLLKTMLKKLSSDFAFYVKRVITDSFCWVFSYQVLSSSLLALAETQSFKSGF